MTGCRAYVAALRTRHGRPIDRAAYPAEHRRGAGAPPVRAPPARGLRGRCRVRRRLAALGRQRRRNVARARAPDRRPCGGCRRNRGRAVGAARRRRRAHEGRALASSSARTRVPAADGGSEPGPARRLNLAIRELAGAFKSTMSSRDGDGHVLDHRRVQMRTPRSGNRRRFRNAVVPRRLPALGRCGIHAIERAGCHHHEKLNLPPYCLQDAHHRASACFPVARRRIHVKAAHRV